jgi:polysaccharide export outer membrane protein
MIRHIKQYIFLFLVLVVAGGCLNQSIMLKTDPKFNFDKTPDYKQIPEYKVSSNDILTFEIYPNTGFNLINTSSFTSGMSVTSGVTHGRIEYLVDSDGNIKLPIVGSKYVAGLTIRELENLLEESYSDFYNKPFVVARVTNKRVIYFTGNTSDAKVIPLVSNNTTLLQLIAMDGGMNEFGKAKRVKIVREVKGKYEVYLINLSTMYNIEQANIVLQANDVVYIEPRKRVARKLRTEIIPFMSLISSTTLLIVVLTNRFTQ